MEIQNVKHRISREKSGLWRHPGATGRVQIFRRRPLKFAAIGALKFNLGGNWGRELGRKSRYVLVDGVWGCGVDRLYAATPPGQREDKIRLDEIK